MDDYIELETQCDDCRGEGMVHGRTCGTCNGERSVLTEFGTRVVDLIDRRIAVALSRLDRVIG